MIYSFKYRSVKDILSEVIDLNDLNGDIVNNNIIINITTEDNKHFNVYINNSGESLSFESNKIYSKLDLLYKKYVIAKIATYLQKDESFRIVDNDTKICIKRVQGFGSPVILIGDDGYILAVPIEGHYNYQDVDDIAFSLIKYSNEHEFPEGDFFKIILNIDIFQRLPDEFKEYNFFEIN